MSTVVNSMKRGTSGINGIHTKLVEKGVISSNEVVPIEQYPNRIDDINAVSLQNKSVSVTNNGTQYVNPDAQYDGLQSVTLNVNVQPTLQSKTATSNGLVEPDSGYDGLSSVNVNVPSSAPNLQNKTVSITDNGTEQVTCDSDYDGLDTVTIETDVEPALQSKTVNTNGVVEPDSGYDGLSSVTVNVTSLQQTVSYANERYIHYDLKNDLSINDNDIYCINFDADAPVGFNAIDITASGITSDDHVYAYFDATEHTLNYYTPSDRLGIKSVNGGDGYGGYFSYLVNLVELKGLSKLIFEDYSTNWKKLFIGCTNLKGSEVSKLFDEVDTQYITSCENMFRECTHLGTVVLNNVDLRRCTTMSEMFSFVGADDIVIIGGKYTALTTMENMFRGAQLNSIHLTDMLLPALTTMYQFHDKGGSLAPDLITKSVKFTNIQAPLLSNLKYLLNENKVMTTVELDITSTSLEDLEGMLANCRTITLVDLGTFDTSNVTAVTSMFYNCNNLVTIKVDSNIWDVSSFNVEMFYNCNSLVGADGFSFASNTDPDKEKAVFAKVNTSSVDGYLTEVI